MFCCSREESEIYNGGVYNIPMYGNLKFAGFSGIKKILIETSLNNDFTHPFYKNIIDGDWFLEYHLNWIRRYAKRNLEKFTDIF